MDSRGYFTIKGRIKEMIIRGGENIYPREVELLLNEHPEVREAALVGIPDSRWGEVVAAVIIPASCQQPPDIDALSAYCNSNLASYKVPRQWYFTDRLPMTETGKIQKFKLLEAIVSKQLKAE
jgi:fatty-acyl-CoA synthase